ncbi:MAG TPA: glycosyltransferase [Candidatus Acidoferrales bacterium]|nr:glycosyltransferase [Candidatus Acidoferrales bacterium]
MKILTVHNSYQQPGGEDKVAAAEAELLMARGHTVVYYRRDNRELGEKQRPFRILGTAARTIWSAQSYAALSKLLARERPDIAHFHNTFPLISPAGYYACANAGVPVVQTLHNYRLLCPAATCFRNGAVCELCLKRPLPWPGVMHACYRNSRLQTAVAAAMLATHRCLKTWQQKVKMYIALSEFSRNKFVEAGLRPDCVRVKPNFVSDPGRPDSRQKQSSRQYALYVGRLAPEKGIHDALFAWRMSKLDIPLLIAGDGPLREDVRQSIAAQGSRKIEYLACVSPAAVTTLMRDAHFLIFPSNWYECFPLTIVEAFACGLPVIGSRLGALAEIIRDGSTGLLFTPTDTSDLSAKIDWAWTHPAELAQMGRAARAEYVAKYAPERNYEQLMDIYHAVLANRGDHAENEI